MAINIQQLSSKIRERVGEDKRIEPTEFSIVSQSDSSPVISSVRSALKPTEPERTGVVLGAVKAIPSVTKEAVTGFLKREEEFRETATFKEQAVRDLIERPAKILNVIGVDLPRLVLGGMSSLGKSVLEAAYTPVFGKEKVRERLDEPELEKIAFAGETKSWQEIKEDVDEFTAKSPEATDWEKKHLGVTLAVAGFAADAWVGGVGKSKIATKLLKELVKETDDIAIRQLLIKNKIPQQLADDAAITIAKATDTKAVENALKTSAQKILKETGEAGVDIAKAAKVVDEVPVKAPARKIAVEAVEPTVKKPITFAEAKRLIQKEGGFANLKSKPARDAYAAEQLGDSFNLNKKFLFDKSQTTDIDLLKELQAIDAIDDSVKRATAATDLVTKLSETPDIVKAKVIDDAPVKVSITTLKKEALEYPSAENFAAVANRKYGLSSKQAIDIYNEAAVKPTITPEVRKAVKAIDDSTTFKTTAKKSNRPTKKSIEAYKDERGKVAKTRDAIIEQVQDDMIRVRRLVEDKALKISEQANPYDAEIAFHGRVGTRIEDLKLRAENIDKDILGVSKKVNVPDEQFAKEVNDFLIARHAPERNAALQDGAAGITTKNATKRMKEIEALPHSKEIKRIADDIQKFNNETLDVLKDGEVISDELYDTLRNKYKNHIPLYRIMDSEEDFAGAMARGFNVTGTGIKVAKGSEREVSDVLGNVVYNYEQAIVRAEKNRVDLSTLKMVRDNKEALKGMFKIRKPKIVGKSWSGVPITEVITDPKILVMREKGKVVLIEIKDEHLALALRGVARQKLGGMMRGIGAVTRTYAGVHTRFNPEFAFSNKIRDIQEVLVYSSAQGELGAKGTAKIAAREARLENVRAVVQSLRGQDTEGAKLYKQMRDDGGTTGGLGLSHKQQIELDMNDMRKLNRSNPRKAAQKTIEYIDNWNTIFEDSSRLSVYKQALENGASRQRAAILAKESSINFNKFGKQGQIINALWIFSNASIQGTTKMVRAMRNPKVAAAVSTAVFGSVAAVSEWNNKVDPDWRNKITTWDRLNSLAVMLPAGEGEGVKYITIPVAWGIKPIKVMADKIYDLASGEGEGLIDAMGAVTVSILEAYNPVGGSNVVSAITPTILDIPLEWASNTAWHGGAIRPDWDRNAPASIQYFKSLRDSTTGRASIGISKGLSGIGMEISPADIHYSFEQIVGGAGRAAKKTFNTMMAISGGELPPAKDVPIVSRFYKTRPDEEVGAGAKEFEQIASMLEEQSREKFYLSQDAEDALKQLGEISKEDAADMYDRIKENDPDLAKEISKIKKKQDKGLTFIDRKILQLGVGNGERAEFLDMKFRELKTQEEKAQLWQEYKAKGIISDTVSKQLKKLLK